MVKSLFQILQIYLFKKILELLQLSNELSIINTRNNFYNSLLYYKNNFNFIPEKNLK
jgi:hypothetical protein